MESKNLEDLRCEDCCYSRFYTDEPEEVSICRLYIENDDLTKFPVNEEISRRKKAGERLRVCKYFLNRRKCLEAIRAVLFLKIKVKREALEKMANDIVELQSKKSQDTGAMIEGYKKRLGDLNEEIVSYNKIIKEISPIQNKKK